MHPTKILSLALGTSVLCAGAAAWAQAPKPDRRCSCGARAHRGAHAAARAADAVQGAGGVHEAVRGDLEMRSDVPRRARWARAK